MAIEFSKAIRRSRLSASISGISITRRGIGVGARLKTP